MWTIQTHQRERGAPRILLIVHSGDRTDDRVLELGPSGAVELAVDLLNAATGRDDDC